MIYAQFFQQGLGIERGKLVEACGDRSVVIMDGRSPQRHAGWAREECLKRGYAGWQLFKGESFTRSRPVSEICEVM